MATFNDVNSYDYRKLSKLFAGITKDMLGLTLIASNVQGNQPEAPFVVFDIVSPYIPIDEFLDITEEEAFEAVVSFTVFDDNKLDALRVAQALRKTLTQFDVDLQLRASDVILVELMPTNVRSVPDNVQEAHMVGFDVRLRLTETYTDSTVEVIEDVEVNEK